MPKVHVTTADNEEREIDIEIGSSLMSALRDNGFEDILALCGGYCSCGTCHIEIIAGPETVKNVGSDDENDLLEMSEYRKASSRLSCQIPVTEELNGMRIRLVPNE